MKIQGRYGTFTPRPDQSAFYAKRQEKERRHRKAKAESLAEWLHTYRECAAGCGKPVAFYDEINYALRYSGCCSSTCEAIFRQAQEGKQP